MNVKLDYFQEQLFLKTALEKFKNVLFFKEHFVLEKFKNILFFSSSRTYLFYSHTARFHGNTKLLNQNLVKHQKSILCKEKKKKIRSMTHVPDSQLPLGHPSNY